MTKNFVSVARGNFWKLAGISLALLVSLSASAQLPTATISGVVKDSSGAVIPDVTITVTSKETGQSRTSKSGSDGSYRFPALRVGSYEIRTEHPGFQTEVRSGVTLAVAQEAVVDFALQLGTIEQTLSVTAEAPLVNTTSGSLGGLVDEQKVADLPLNGRNYIDLTLLQPGVQQQKNMNFGSGKAGTWFSSNGAPYRSNNLLLDGAILQNLQGGTSASISGQTLGVEGIREFRVVTNSVSAEYGLTMGSQMVIVSKGGTNTFHGSLFEYTRNSALDARNFFDRTTATTPRRLPAFTRNNFGASAGGPIQKDKIFVFGVFEGVRERLGRTLVTGTIPASARVDGGLVPQISPVIKPLLSLFPEPNLGTNEYTFSFGQPTTENYGQARVDETLSSDDTLFGRYTISDAEQITPQNFPQFKNIGVTRSQFVTVSENHIFSPNLLNTARFSFSRTKILFASPSGVSGPQFSFISGQEIGQLSVGGVTLAGTQQNFGPDGTTPNIKKQNIFTWSDDLFYTRGRHSLKLGALINRYQQYFLNSNGLRGSVSFANLTTFLEGRPTTYSALTPGSISDKTYHFTTFGFYAQDDLRVTSSLMLNLGLRYEVMDQIEEAHGNSSFLRDLARGAQFEIGPPFQNPSLRNFSPRFGFAWDVRGNGKTAVRGGFGLLYDLNGHLGPALISSVFGSPPFASTTTIANPPTFTIPLTIPAVASGRALATMDYNLGQPHMLQYNLTVERQLPFQTALTLAYAGSRGINLLQRKEGNPTVPQGNPQARVCLPASTPPPFRADGPKCWTGQDPRTNPNWANNSLATTSGSSWYNSLQVSLTKRLSHGLQFQSSYTWSKVFDETQGGAAGDGTTNTVTGTDPSNRKVDRGPADFDVNHNWRFNAIYRIPQLTLEGAFAKLLNGWWTSGILSLQTGYPFTPVLGSNRSRSNVGGGGGGVDRPDALPGRSNDDIILGGPARYFDPGAFAIPPLGFLGNSARGFLRGPGLASLDFSLGKDTALGFLGESGKLEFRAEFFNILNRVNFAMPSTQVFAGVRDVEPPLANAGRIVATASSSRQVQLALKVVW